MGRIRYINGVPNAPEAIGPYSQAVICDNNVYLSGQIPIHPATNQIISEDIEMQTEQVMKNLIAVLGFMGIDFSHVVKSRIYLTDLSNFAKVNNVYAKWMGQYKPARVTIQAAALPKEARVEIEMEAVLELDDTMMVPHGSSESMDEMGVESYQAGKCDD
jgi:2-iminobutanoate/2-iminopropanoate deaminase